MFTTPGRKSVDDKHHHHKISTKPVSFFTLMKVVGDGRIGLAPEVEDEAEAEDEVEVATGEPSTSDSSDLSFFVRMRFTFSTGKSLSLRLVVVDELILTSMLEAEEEEDQRR